MSETKLDLVACKPFEIPLALLRQKDAWDLRVWLEAAMYAQNWYGFRIDLEGEPVGAFVLEANATYRSVHIGTMILDQDHRGGDVHRTAYNLARTTAQRLAGALEFDSISFSTFRPAFVLELLDPAPEGVRRRKPRVVEYVLREGVWDA